MSAFEKILCPTDFSEASYNGLNAAINLARAGAGEICIVHVEPNLQDLLASGVLPPHEATDQRAEAINSLRKVIEEHTPNDIRAYTMLRQGETALEIVALARQQMVDVIVMTTHGAGGHKPSALGSVAAEVIQKAPCPVLIVNTDAEVEICDTRLGEEQEYAIQDAFAA